MYAKASTLRATLLAAALSFSLAGVAGAAKAGEPAVYQASELNHFMTATPAGGAATLVRRSQSLATSVAASHLDANAAYTLWWIIFNHPAACNDGCGLDDLPNAAAGPSVLYATSFVTGADGTANVSARLDSGDPPQGYDVVVGNGLDSGNGFAAEVHVAIHSHGPILMGNAAGQLSSFVGVCNPECVTQQAAVFAPVP